MATISASVGRNGVNRTADVLTIQTLLNQRRLPGEVALAITGAVDPEMIEAIVAFQRRALNLVNPDGRVDPGGRTLRALDPASAADANLSGAAWWHANQARFPNSAQVEDLEPNFRAKLQEFLAALRTAGARVEINATRRNKQRAYLMHHCFRVANGSEQPSAVPDEPGVNIVWDHGNLGQSRRAAGEMVELFDIAFEPSLTSLHITGRAVDMEINWAGLLTIRAKGGQTFRIGEPRSGANTVLHQVGRSYGVIKLVADPPHWSIDGH